MDGSMTVNAMRVREDVEALVSPADTADAADIARVHVAAWRAAYRGMLTPAFLAGLDVGARAEQWRNWLQLPERRTLVAKQRGAVLGFCAMGPARDPDANASTSEVYALYVDEPYWRTGHGRALLERAITDAEDEGAAQVTLWVLEQNERARLFYEKLGFVFDGVSKIELIGGTALTELRYRRRFA